jgi:hypothetical protein
VIDFFGIRSSIEDWENIALPDKSIVLRAFPNPFNAEVKLQLLSGIEGELKLDIFDITGRKIRSFEVSGHTRNVNWDGQNEYGRPVSSGVYFARITGPNQKSSAIKLTLLR